MKLGGVGSRDGGDHGVHLPQSLEMVKKLCDYHMQTYCNSKRGFSKTGGICTSDSHIQEGFFQSPFLPESLQTCQQAMQASNFSQ